MEDLKILLLEKEKEIKKLEEWKEQALIANNIILKSIQLFERKSNFIDLSMYECSEEDLQKVSLFCEKIRLIFLHDSNLHEDLIENLLFPFERLLSHNGINLIEYDV